MKKSTKYLIGIDAGASNTEVIVSPVTPLQKGGRGDFHHKFPSINYNIAGHQKTIACIKEIIEISAKKISFNNCISIVIGISGCRNKKDRDEIQKHLKNKFKIKNISILPDTEIAFASIFSKNDRNCGILIGGTGSILYYRDGFGKINRIGGWGRYIGDEGSGYWIGKQALNKLAKFYDGIGDKTMLIEVLKKNYGINPNSLIQKIYHENFEISKIAKHVFDCAESRDKISGDIIKEAAEQLAFHLNIFKKSKTKIALLGSLFTKELLLKKYFKKIVKERFPNIQLISSILNPVWGAVKIGLERYKI